MRVWTGIALFALGVLTFAASGRALTIENQGADTIKVAVEKWFTYVRPGNMAVFNPSASPTTVRGEARHFQLICEAGADDTVVFLDSTCLVNGQDTGRSQMQL